MDAATDSLHPGMVDSNAVRKKLSKQLKIDLERHEFVHLRPEPVNFADLNERDMDNLMETLGAAETKCEVEIKKLGEYVARLSLGGGYSVPLRFEVLKR